MFLVLIETSGNQNYIFSTNKLKENIGASQLTYLAGTRWVIDAVATIDKKHPLALWTDKGSEQLRKKLLDPKFNPPIEPIEKTNFDAEIILAASGIAMLLVKERDKAKAIIRHVTLQAFKEAPGLEVSGVIHSFDWNEERSLVPAIKTIHQEFEANRSQIPSSEMRFLRLPVVEECAFSGLPASGLEENGKGISKVCQTKRNAKEESLERIAALLPTDYSTAKFADSLKRLDPDFEKPTSKDEYCPVEWLGVIHADGNGLGKIFINFPQHLKKIAKYQQAGYTNRDYVNELRNFSLALDTCTENAFLAALSVFNQEESEEKKGFPIFPLVLGGDDLTVICDGKFALPFTRKFLTKFEAETKKSKIIREIAQVALKGDRLSACAGIAIIKPHFPFSVAYELAESLAKSAKQVKKVVVTQSSADSEKIPYPCSALDFHVVYDSSGVEREQIRQRLTVDGDHTKLYRRPYVVTPESDLEAAKGQEWLKAHRWELLQEWVETLKATDSEGKQKLPNNQIYKLREYLALGESVADSYYGSIKKRYLEQGIAKLEGKEDSLFVVEPSVNSEAPEIHATGLLDAIEAAEFM